MLLIFVLSRHLVASALAMQLKRLNAFKTCLLRSQANNLAQLVRLRRTQSADKKVLLEACTGKTLASFFSRSFGADDASK
jgi:hypothetical protein